MFALLVISLVVLQDAPGPAPGPRPGPPVEPPGRDGQLTVGPFGDGRGLPPYLRNDPRVSQEPPDEEEWEAISAFMESNSPHRWSAYRRFEEQARAAGRESPIVNNLRRRMAVRYRMLMLLKQDQPELYEFVVTQGKIEDDAIRIISRMREQPDDPSMRSQLREVAERFVQNTLKERQTRIERLRRALAREEAELARDRENVTPLVDRLEQRFREEAGDFERMERIREWRERGGIGRPPGPSGAGRPGERPERPGDRPSRQPAN